ncbi:hypothetical protein ACH474_03700 [Nocardia rhamnosiphila]|uniref:Uncharacterized protein n=1 Tax=Nocardia rhamnosiphila TaxID=426716 RepID=A0ABV2WT76_9NOCA
MTEEPPAYSAADLRPTVWGSRARYDDGRWETVWRLTFAAPRARQTLAVHQDEKAGFRAVLETYGGTGGELRVLTRRDAMAAEYYPLTFTSFAIVNDTVGELREIQGRPRDWYAPFRDRVDE